MICFIHTLLVKETTDCYNYISGYAMRKSAGIPGNTNMRLKLHIKAMKCKEMP